MLLRDYSNGAAVFIALVTATLAGCEKRPAPATISATAATQRDAPLVVQTQPAPSSTGRVQTVPPAAPMPGLLPPSSCAYAGLEVCIRRCEERDDDSCAALALLYANGWGAPVDESRAVELAKASCSNRSATGCGLLGSFHGLGVGVARDPRRAQELLMFGCEGHDALSCESLGGQYVDASLGTVDLKAAAGYFLKACDLGHMRACFKAGAAIQDGKLQAPRLPSELYRKSCEAGFATACYLLGNHLESGAEGSPDVGGAEAAFARACELGHQKACARRSAPQAH